MPIKDPVKRAEYERGRWEKNKEKLKIYKKEHRKKNRDAINSQKMETYKANKENITYIITVGDCYYIGHTSIGLDARKRGHFGDIKNEKGSRGLRDLFHEMGEEAFRKAFDIKKLETFDTKEEAKLAEKKLLEDNVGKKYCLNKHK